MKAPIDCPVCGGSLMNNYIGPPDSQLLQKSCAKRLDHKLFYVSKFKNDDEISLISIHISPGILVMWTPDQKDLEIRNVAETTGFKLPYFEPNFKNYKKLVTKLKTYLTFS